MTPSDGKLYTSYLSRNDSSKTFSLIASRPEHGLSANNVTGVLEGDLSDIVFSFSDAELRRGTDVAQVGRVLLKRKKDMSEGGFAWEADGRIEAVVNGRSQVLQASCFVNGNPGTLSAFFRKKVGL